MTQKKNKSALLKSLRNAAVIAFGGAALLGAGYGAQKTLEHFSAPAPIVETQTPEQQVALEKLSHRFDGQSWRDIHDALPQGDGHPVLVIPGFMTNDLYMMQLRHRIEAQGYKAYGWHEGMNLGASQDDAEKLVARLREISAENGGKKVSIVGYSLGGVYARELARQYPDLVRNVITLSSPFGSHDWRGQPDEAVARIHRYYTHRDGTSQNDVVTPPPVPTTSVYSKNDWIVDWRTALNPPAPAAENVEVRSGHVALPFNDAAAAVVLDRLAQKQERWQPYWKSAVDMPATKFPGLAPA